MKKFIYFFLIIGSFSCKKDNYITNNFNDSNKEDTSKLNNQESNSLENQENSIEFGNLFNEGSQINFTPSDLVNPSNEEQKEFKKKLSEFENSIPIEDFDPENLKILINNSTYFDSQYYVNSQWLDYFIKKFKLENYLDSIMQEAIKNEDFNAVKIIIANNYIVNLTNIEMANERKSEQKLLIERDVKENENFYIKEKSKIDEIIILLNKKFNSNMIFDKDGYSNLRSKPSSNSDIITKINTNEHIIVLKCIEEDVEESKKGWYYIETKDGKKGYVHKSRIVSK
ncbi:SH3 domain-containing protein [Flavobacterium columnare]|uniref:SH3 domain-containing protein n=1 Tax=Flavobacterium columnare TaxID=996 RepID=A0A437U9Q3_9FLAO|nr:SH3 domain-containing protein [Flavobacterium columnare]RVU90359.1 SH3 domain-containing protein [Flavobacterium columnare]